MAMIDRRAVRSAKCKAVDKAVVAEISEHDFSAIAEVYPKLWRGIASEISSRLFDRNGMVKKSISFGHFLVDEIIRYLVTMTIVFIFAVFMTNTLQDEGALTDFVVQRINSDSMIEIMVLLLSILVVIGLLQLARQMTDSQRVEGYVREFLQEVPRAIYFFGASLSGALFAIVVFLYMSEDTRSLASNYVILALVFSIMVFVLGFTVNFFLKRKERKIRPISWLF